MDNSEPISARTSALYNRGNKNRRQNLVWEFTKTIIPFALVGYEVIITNSRYALVGYFITSYPTRAHGIIVIYNNPSYSRILIGSCLWSIRGQTHDWRHHYRVLASAALKWRKVLRIRITFFVTGQKIRYKKVLPRHWTGSRSQKAKDKDVSFRKWYRNNFLAASVAGSRARLNHAQTWSW